jgi:LTXXQ motif family protein
MFTFMNTAVRAVAAATLLSTFIFANPLKANAAEQAPAPKSPPVHDILAKSSPLAKTAPAPAPAEANAAVEARIKELHSKLHITATEQTQWDSLVEVMRGNATAMIDLQRQRARDVKSMSAVDAVKSYAAVIEAHETGMSKFVPAFQALYDSMSAKQKVIADAMFRTRVRSAAKKGSA